MENMKIFENSEFGKVRTVMIDGKIHFVAIDVARILEYADPHHAIYDHCKGMCKLPIPSGRGTQETNIIPKGDVFRLITKAAEQSKNLRIKEKAERFESWIYDEVLTDIDNHAMYMTGGKLNG